MTKKILAALLPSLVVYLLGSFIAADFNVINWGSDGRLIAVLAAVWSTLFSVAATSDFM